MPLAEFFRHQVAHGAKIESSTHCFDPQGEDGPYLSANISGLTGDWEARLTGVLRPFQAHYTKRQNFVAVEGPHDRETITLLANAATYLKTVSKSHSDE